jgi:hypothetical protein
MRALLLIALGVELGCGANGDQVLGTFKPGEVPILVDGGPGGTDAIACPSHQQFAGQ